MSEIELEVTTKKVIKKCGECDNGYLSFINKVKQGINGKPLFIHQCHKCKKLFDLKKRYPAIKFIDNKGGVIESL